jgi:hypothetical protein
VDPSAADSVEGLKELLPDGAVRIAEPALGLKLLRTELGIDPPPASGSRKTDRRKHVAA